MRRLLMVITLAAMPGAVAQATPILQAITVSGGLIQNNGFFSLGWEFLLDRATAVTALGFWDGGAPGFTDAHEIAIYSCGDPGCTVGTQVISGIVPVAGGTLLNGFVYQNLASPVLLPGGTYVIAGLTHTELYTYLGDVTLGPGVHFVQDRYIQLRDNLVTTVVFPTTTWGANGFFGPSFLFEAPEPAGIWLIPGGIALLALFRKRTRPSAGSNR